ncbi:MAG: GNAT family N-acetyltransferase [Clostridiales bacterium]|nr:GNAT family N-acetyltransferase [Clostridiales bacterium]
MVRAEWLEESGVYNLNIYEDGERAALGRLTVRDSVCKIAYMVVFSEHRGKKYGDFLMRLLIRRAYELGCREQYVDIPAELVDFFKKYEFQVTGPAGGGCLRLRREGDITGDCE